MGAYRAVYLWEAQHGVAQGQSSRGRCPLNGDRRGYLKAPPLFKNGTEGRGIGYKKITSPGRYGVCRDSFIGDGRLFLSCSSA